VERHGYLTDPGADPAELLVGAETAARQERNLATLAQALAGLLRQVFGEGRTNTAIAAAQGVSETAIRNRLHKIYARLRNQLP